MSGNTGRKIRVLTFVGYYLPGYKAGGPLRTLANMAEHLDDSIEFWIITSDRDQGDVERYSSVNMDTWQKVGNTNVFYMRPEHRTVCKFADIISSTPHDVIYLNSYFDPVFTFKPLLGNYFIKSSRKPVILAPRGEFSKAALSIKKFRKAFFIKLMSFLYKGLYFQASSIYEQEDILRALPWVREKNSIIAIDLPAKLEPMKHTNSDIPKDSVTLNIIFLSRISRMKNLNYALEVLKDVKSKILFDIYGPQEDSTYWEECEHIIKSLPGNIKASYKGNVFPEHVKSTFSRYDLFFLPSKGENYGHVIAESISVGTPVLLSDNTPWRDLRKEGVGWDIPLNSPSTFVSIIEDYASLSNKEREMNRAKVYGKAVQMLTDESAINSNRQLFLSVLDTDTI
ncbi:glycosyltransferase [Pseudomonas sp. TH05]|uniref:glycosyltransferase n=1 Tax=unclassified Pseudomonas TaxID=196821 RepID=UPI0019130C0C|nr:MULTISPECIES: glycosyltransferase [unclassified Pseudomonas]MBK5537024.1 glycosyltransferase [Pseudomonas sp. TH07]MBK5559897.1 glycosyltransferase [Pseudomonas sp. TH05]